MIKVEKKNNEAADGIKIEITGIKDDVVEECLALIRAAENIEVLRDAVGDALDKAVNDAEEVKNEFHQELS